MTVSEKIAAEELTESSTSRFAKVDGETVHYHEAGSGPALIMLHGAGPGASGWSNFKQNIGYFAKSYRVLLIDHPGFGKSTKTIPEEEVRSGFGARLIVGLMDQLEIDKADFIGNSWGGRTSMGIALKWPERVRRMVLMGPGGGLNLFHAQPTEGMKQLHEFFSPPGPSRERMENLIRTFLFDSSAITPELIDERLASATEAETAEFYKKHLVEPDPREPQLWRELETIGHKTLLIWGRDDRTVPFEGGLIMLRRLQDARMHIISRCGHWVQMEKADEFNALVQNFLSQD